MKNGKFLSSFYLLGLLAQPYVAAHSNDLPRQYQVTQHRTVDPKSAPAKSESAPLLGFRFSAAVGPRKINSQVMPGDMWDTVMRLGFASFLRCRTYHCLYGLEVSGNSSWTSRFNSVNRANNVTVSPVGLSNSSSLDFLFFWAWAPKTIGIEIGFGPELSWIKWTNSVQLATSRTRVVPKLSVSLSHQVAKNTDIFLAASQTFNPYAELACSNRSFNCFNDEGYVSTTDITLGLKRYF